MRINTEIDKLQKKIEKEKEFKHSSKITKTGGYLFIDPRKKESKRRDLREQLNFLKKLLNMINEGATGFDLAYEVERNQEVKQLIYDGILFYNTFLEIGNKKFIESPDKITTTYKSFKTIEDTEKQIFMVWLKDTIDTLEKDIQPREDYSKYIEERKAQDEKEAIEKLRETLTHCKNCGAQIRSKEQEFCEKCGINIIETIIK
ncbi:MAG: zinc ribbon domain-containing protein [Promethearchaeota archaeon]